MAAISRAWYNVLYHMSAKPIKKLELHYTMIQFVIILLKMGEGGGSGGLNIGVNLRFRIGWVRQLKTKLRASNSQRADIRERLLSE